MGAVLELFEDSLCSLRLRRRSEDWSIYRGEFVESTFAKRCMWTQVDKEKNESSGRAQDRRHATRSN